MNAAGIRVNVTVVFAHLLFHVLETAVHAQQLAEQRALGPALSPSELKRQHVYKTIALLEHGDVLAFEGFRARDLVPEERRTPETVVLFRAIATTAQGAAAKRWYGPDVSATLEQLVAACGSLEDAFVAWESERRSPAWSEFAMQEAALIDRIDALGKDLVARERRGAAVPSVDRNDRAHAHRENAQLALDESRWDDAVYELERVVALEPTDANKAELKSVRDLADVENYRAWAERHAAAGKVKDAVECLERLLRRAPADAAARAMLERLRA